MTQRSMPVMDRRLLLKGAGFTLGLPLLESMTTAGKSAFADKRLPVSASGDSFALPTRMACLFVPNGVIQDVWHPQGQGAGDQWQLSPTLMPLASLKSKINVLSGLAHDNGRARNDGAGDHARSGATFLTAARPVKTSSKIRLGISMDQMAAEKLKTQTTLPSIELGLEGSRNAGSCDSGYSCAYSSNISWRSETQPMPKETIPRAAFERLFGSADDNSRKRSQWMRQSILDVVRSDAEKLMKKVGRDDRLKLDEYFTSVREIERRIESTEAADVESRPDLKIPDGRVEAFPEHCRLMMDLIVLAFQTDTTRVATLMLDNASGRRVYRQVGARGAHHGLSHHQNKQDSIDQLRKIDHYLVQQLAYFLDRLDAVSEGVDINGKPATLLDQSMVLYGSGIGDGNRHTHHDLPIILAGRGGGRIPGDRHLVYQKEKPMANLFLSMLDLMGTPAEAIGDSTGRLDGFV